MANQNSALHNLGSGRWLARASGAAVLCIARTNGHWTRSCRQQAHHRSNQPHQAFTPYAFTRWRYPEWGSGHLFDRPQKDERLSWPSWLTCSGQFTHMSGHTSAAGRAQDRQILPAKDRCATQPTGHYGRKHIFMLAHVFTVRCNARIASAVLAIAFPFVCPSVCRTRRYCVKTTANSTVQLHCQAAKCV